MLLSARSFWTSSLLAGVLKSLQDLSLIIVSFLYCLIAVVLFILIYAQGKVAVACTIF
nr:MAG TPA: hypothetical protein [Caudoviricetes sp.]